MDEDYNDSRDVDVNVHADNSINKTSSYFSIIEELDELNSKTSPASLTGTTFGGLETSSTTKPNKTKLNFELGNSSKQAFSSSGKALKSCFQSHSPAPSISKAHSSFVEKPPASFPSTSFVGKPSSSSHPPSFVGCTHDVCTVNDGYRICNDCGCRLEELLNFEPEWRYYSDVKTKDPSRCHKPKEILKGGIEKVFQDAMLVHIPESIKRQTEVYYQLVVDNVTFRGQGRKARVAACLFHVYLKGGEAITSDEVRHWFDLSKQEMSDGLTAYYIKFPEDRTLTQEPIDQVPRIMRKTGIDPIHTKKIKRMVEYLTKDPSLNHSNPQSVAASIIYLYLCAIEPEYKKELGLTKSKFSTKAGMSDITITKLAKQAAEHLDVKVDI